MEKGRKTGRDGMDEKELASLIHDVTGRVIGCAFAVSNGLKSGFLEKVYENALAHECRKAGLVVEQQRRLVVRYDGVEVGEYVADLVVNDLVLVEVKAGKGLDPAHDAQCLNYLVATGLPVCLLLHFGVRVDVRRIIGPNAPTFPPGDASKAIQ